MKDRTPLTEAEAKIMQHLWSHSPQTMMELTRALEPETSWSKYTVITLLKRMSQKGTVNVDETGAVKLYSPAVEKEALAREQTDALVSRMYGGRASLLVSNLVERGISDDELNEIMEIVNKARK